VTSVFLVNLVKFNGKILFSAWLVLLVLSSVRCLF
jgi:hypothetical protein